MADDKIFEIFLTSDQSKFINQQLPKGYSLQFTSFPTRRVQPQSTIARPLSEQNLAYASQKVTTRQRVSMHQLESDPGDDNDTRSDSNLKKNKLKKAQEKQKQKNSKSQYAPGATESTKRSNVEELRLCMEIIIQLKKSENSTPFVNQINNQSSDLFQAQTGTVDLQKVETKLAQGVYSSKNEFADDMNRIWENAQIYSQPGSEIFEKAKEMKRLFGHLFEKLKTQPQPKANSKEMDVSKKTSQGTTASQIQSTKDKQESLKKKLKTNEPAVVTAATASAATVAANKPEIRLNQREKEWVYQNVSKLDEKDMIILCSMIQRYCQTTNESMELNLDTLPIKIARDVLDFVVSKLGSTSPPLPQNQDYSTKTEEAQKKKKQGKTDKMEVPLSISEKKQLGLNIRELPAEDLTGIWSIVQDSPQHSEVIEFDIDTLPVRKARELEAYVKDKIASKLKKQKNMKTTTTTPTTATTNPPFQQQTTTANPYEQQIQQPSVSQSSTNAFPKQPAAYSYEQSAGIQSQQAFQQAASVSSLPNGGVGSLASGAQQFLSSQNGASPSPLTSTQQQPNLGQMTGYSNQFVPQSAAAVNTYKNQMMMPQFASNFPMQQQMKSALMGGYSGIPVGFGADSSSQPGAMQHQFSAQPYAGQQTPYQTFGNGMTSIYQGQLPNGAAGNPRSQQQAGLNSAQMQYGTGVSSGMGSYGGQPVTNYYTASQSQQQYAAQYQQMQQQQTAGQLNGKYATSATFGNLQNIPKTTTAMPRVHNSDQSSEEMLSQELSGA